MQKTKDISKFDLDWQIVRAFVKGPKMDVTRKLYFVNDFYRSHKSKENWERVFNWLEGLLKGYKKFNTQYTQYAHTLIQDLIEEYKQVDISKLPFIESENDFSKYNFEQRYTLWKDLLKRTKSWAKNGYIHNEQVEFCNALWNSFTYDELEKISPYYSKENFDMIIASTKGKPNTHKFLF